MQRVQGTEKKPIQFPDATSLPRKTNPPCSAVKKLITPQVANWMHVTVNLGFSEDDQ
jgi:hypothetical protein